MWFKGDGPETFMFLYSFRSRDALWRLFLQSPTITTTQFQ